VACVTVVAGVGGALTRGVAERGCTLCTMPLTRGVPGTRGVAGRPNGVPTEGVEGMANPLDAAGEAPATGVGGAPLTARRCAFCEEKKRIGNGGRVKRGRTYPLLLHLLVLRCFCQEGTGVPLMQ
jgi:hypothetical protein